MPALALLPVC